MIKEEYKSKVFKSKEFVKKYGDWNGCWDDRNRRGNIE